MIFLLILLLPSQLAYHFWPSWSLINGIRVDYLSPTLYLTDLIILGLFLTSRLRVRIPLPLIIFVVLNILISYSPLASLYKWLRVLEYFWLFKYLVNFYELKTINYALALSILWTSTLAWWQFFLQHSVGGLWYWLGERTFSITTPGIAKVFISQLGLVMRPYATMPHPNALAGWLLVAGLIVEGWPRIVSLITIPLTFSRSVILLLPALLWRKSKLLTLLLFVMSFVLFANVGNPSSLPERLALNQLAINSISNSPLFGVGLGNFIYQVPTIRQPVHNIYLLLAAELGVPATAMVVFLIIGKLKNLLRLENWNLRIAILSILLTGLADHYWLTLHQNSLLLVILLAYVHSYQYRRRS